MTSPLVDWTRTQISALYTPQKAHGHENAEIDDAAQLQNALDATLAPNAEIQLEDTPVDHAKFRDFVQSRRTAASEVECKPEDLKETPVEEGNAEAGSIVEGKVAMVRTHGFRIRAAPAKTSTVISFRAKVVPGPQPRIVQLIQTSEDKPFPIHLPAIGGNKARADRPDAMVSER
ncbi:hypothetical protein C8R43DRAFT_1131170 [Mycena crocata]|nr:hypothetical protein C8R43DRAFT_1131170 [Mycena crocata]